MPSLSSMSWRISSDQASAPKIPAFSLNLKDAIGKVFVASGTNSTIDNQLVYDITESLEGQTIYFADYTSSTTSVSAVFSNDSSFSNSTSVKMTGKANGLSELYSVVIPGAQKYVKFVDASDNQLGDIYNIYGGTENSVNFAAGSNDTYHYGITEKSDSQKISRWGAVPVGNTSSLAGKNLCFDNKVLQLHQVVISRLEQMQR